MADSTIDELETFEDYTKVVMEAVKNICHDSKMGEEDKVDVLYATPPLAFAKYKSKIINGSNPGPLVSLYLSSIEVDPSVQLLGFTKLTLENKYIMRAPVITRLSYTITINCNNEAQGDLLQGQLLMAMPLNRPYATKLDGQWVTMTSNDPENLSTVEAGPSTEKISRRQLKIIIDRAYLQYDYSVLPNSIIKNLELHFYTIEGITGKMIDPNDAFANRNIEVDVKKQS